MNYSDNWNFLGICGLQEGHFRDVALAIDRKVKIAPPSK